MRGCWLTSKDTNAYTQVRGKTIPIRTWHGPFDSPTDAADELERMVQVFGVNPEDYDITSLSQPILRP